jgi:hypothetical protein
LAYVWQADNVYVLAAVQELQATQVPALLPLQPAL